MVAQKVKKYKDDAYYLIQLQKDTLESIITERTQKLQVEKKRADHQSERLQLALRELNHRVKNNLAVVSSLLKLQSKALRSTEAREVFQESRQRIDAMALIHRQLYQSEEITTIDIPTYITNLAEGLCEAYGFTPFLNLELDLYPLTLPAENAVPLGLILNEVLTNAFKYGLSKANIPRLKITLHNTEPIFLEIQDNGPGINMAYWNQQNMSFGRRLIDGLSQQIRGHYELDGTSGTRFRLWMAPVSEYTVLI